MESITNKLKVWNWKVMLLRGLVLGSELAQQRRDLVTLEFRVWIKSILQSPRPGRTRNAEIIVTILTTVYRLKMKPSCYVLTNWISWTSFSLNLFQRVKQSDIFPV